MLFIILSLLRTTKLNNNIQRLWLNSWGLFGWLEPLKRCTVQSTMNKPRPGMTSVSKNTPFYTQIKLCMSVTPSRWTCQYTHKAWRLSHKPPLLLPTLPPVPTYISPPFLPPCQLKFFSGMAVGHLQSVNWKGFREKRIEEGGGKALGTSSPRWMIFREILWCSGRIWDSKFEG